MVIKLQMQYWFEVKLVVRSMYLRFDEMSPLSHRHGRPQRGSLWESVEWSGGMMVDRARFAVLTKHVGGCDER